MGQTEQRTIISEIPDGFVLDQGVAVKDNWLDVSSSVAFEREGGMSKKSHKRYRLPGEKFDTIGAGHYIDDEKAYSDLAKKLGIPDKEDLSDIKHRKALYDHDFKVRREEIGREYSTASSGLLDIMANTKMQYSPGGFRRLFGQHIKNHDTEAIIRNLRAEGVRLKKAGKSGVVERNEEVIGHIREYNKAIQQKLRFEGKYFGDIDGILGTQSEKATKEFQKERGLKDDGVIGRNTWREMLSSLNPFHVSEASAADFTETYATELPEGFQLETPDDTFLLSINEINSAVAEIEKGVEDRGFWGNLVESFNRGEIAKSINEAKLLVKEGKLSREEVAPLIEAQRQVISADPIEGGNIISSAAYSAAEMLPAMISGVVRGETVGRTAALGAGIAGQLGPQAFTPEEILTVPTAYAFGSAAGGFDYWRRLGEGETWWDMTEEGVKPEVAAPVSSIAGCLYGAIELSQIDKLSPGSKEVIKKISSESLKNTIGKFVKRFGVNWLTEVGEEGAQAAIMQASKETAEALSGIQEDAPVEALGSVFQEGWNAVKQSALPLLLMMAPGGAVDAYKLSKEGSTVRKQMAEDAIENEVVGDPTVEQQQEEVVSLREALKQSQLRAQTKTAMPETRRDLQKEVQERVKKQGEKIEDESLREIREHSLLGKETIDEIIVRKRGIITDKEAIERASSMRVTLDDVLNLPKGVVPNKEQLTAISQVVQNEREINKKIVTLIEEGGASSTKAERALIKELNDGKDLTEEETLQRALEESTMKLRKAEIVLFAAKSEAGRALQGAKQVVAAVDSRLRIALGRIRKLPIPERQAATEQLAEVHLDDNDEFIKFLDKINKSDFFDKFAEWATAIKLWNPTTHVVNAFSNAARQTVDMAITDVTSPQLAIADTQGAWVGLNQGLKNALKALTDEGYARQLSKYIEEGGTAPAIGGNFGKWVRTPFRMLGASDEIFRAMAYQRSLYRQAATIAKGDSAKMKQILERPTFEMGDKAMQEAKRMTFQEDMDEVTRSINRFRTPANFKSNYAKTVALIVRLFVPFLKTPTNLFKQAIDISPLGLVKNQAEIRKAIKNGDDERVKKILGEAILGTMISAFIASLVKEGLVTGGAPREKKDRDQFYREKKLPYAIKIGDKWYQYKRVDPFSTIIGLVADTVELNKEEELNLGGIFDIVSKNLEDKTFLRGISDLIKLTSDEPWERQAAFEGVLLGVTIPSIVGHVARTADPTIRKTENLIDRLKAQTPWLSKTLQPRVNVLGNEIERSNKGLNYFFNPFQSEEAEVDEVTRHLSDIGYSIPLPSNKFTRKNKEYELTGKDYYDYSMALGLELADFIARKNSSLSYQRLDVEKKIKIIERKRTKIMDKLKNAYAEKVRRSQ